MTDLRPWFSDATGPDKAPAFCMVCKAFGLLINHSAQQAAK